MAATDTRTRLVDVFEDVLARCATDGLDPAGELADTALRILAPEQAPPAPAGPTVLAELVAVTGDGALVHLYARSADGDTVVTECGWIMAGADLSPWLDTAVQGRCQVCVDRHARAR